MKKNWCYRKRWMKKNDIELRSRPYKVIYIIKLKIRVEIT